MLYFTNANQTYFYRVSEYRNNEAEYVKWKASAVGAGDATVSPSKHCWSKFARFGYI